MYRRRAQWHHAIILTTVGCLLSAGCFQSPTSEKPVNVLGKEEALAAHLTFVLDLSVSFTEALDGRAFDLFRAINHQFFVGTLGERNRIVLSQLSGARRTVLWEGDVRQFRRSFSSEEDLQRLLREAANEADRRTSEVYRSISNAIEYANASSGISDKTRKLTVILSDLVESGGSPNDRIRQQHKMIDAMKDYTESGGAVAIYFAEQRRRNGWTRVLREQGIDTDRVRIEGAPSTSPELPDFS